MSNQQRRGVNMNRSPIPRYTPPPSPFLSHQTITFLASWRGQLLVCTIVLVIGAIYFFVRPPIDQWHRRRKEALSRKRELELMKMAENEEQSNKAEEKDDLPIKAGNSGSMKDRGREKNKNQSGNRKRINSHLKPPTTDTGTGGSSIESSPAPLASSSLSSPTPTKPKRSLSNTHANNASSSKLQQKSDPKSSKPLPLSTPSRQKPPPPIIVPKPCINSTDPWNIPLPPSPVAGPSKLNRVNGVNGLGMEEISDDAGSASVNDQTEEEPIEVPAKKKFEGFSIYPDEGYLPPAVQTPGNTNKKKKRKNKTPNGISAGTNGSTAMMETSSSEKNPVNNSDEIIENHINGCSLVTTSTSLTNGGRRVRHQHTRTSSITLLPNLNVTELREIVERRDETIDQLRAEIGMAKAEESKAKEEAVRARMGEEKIRGEMERSKRGSYVRSDSQASSVQGHGQGQGISGGQERRREAELQSRLAQMQQLYTTALSRLSTYESTLRDSGIMLPPLPSPIPMLHPQSPLPPMPTSPYVPSPGPGRNTPIMGGGFISYPSPGMYPSPMLHPTHTHYHHHTHSHSPSPYRRTSSFVGAPNGNGEMISYPMDPMDPMGGPLDIGSSTMPIGLGHPNGYGHEGEKDRERRRQSIESSVLKKKVQHLSAIAVENDNDNGNGEVVEEEEVESSDKPTSSSSNGNQDEGSIGESVESVLSSEERDLGSDVNGNTNMDTNTGTVIRVMLDSERGNVCYHDGVVTDNENTGAPEAEIQGDDTESESREKGEFQPIFASLAHTPEQIEEMRQISRKQQDQKRERGTSVSSSLSSTKGTGVGVRMGAGLGNGGLLTPSPCKSPVPLRG
ncbi:hypothetical protein V866_004507 [Kwoniella sp. B9012]